MVPPDVAIGVKADQVPSGAGEFPVRTLMTKLVPAGSWLTQEMQLQSTEVPASKMREL